MVSASAAADVEEGARVHVSSAQLHRPGPEPRLRAHRSEVPELLHAGKLPLRADGLPMKPLDEVDQFAIGVHGALTTLHVLGCVYNWRRRNTLAVVLHAMAALFAPLRSMTTCRPSESNINEQTPHRDRDRDRAPGLRGHRPAADTHSSTDSGADPASTGAPAAAVRRARHHHQIGRAS